MCRDGTALVQHHCKPFELRNHCFSTFALKMDPPITRYWEAKRCRKKSGGIVTPKLCSQDSRKQACCQGGRETRRNVGSTFLRASLCKHLAPPLLYFAFINTRNGENAPFQLSPGTRVWRGLIFPRGLFLSETIIETKHLFLLLFTRGSLSAVMISRVPSASKTTLQIVVEISSFHCCLRK